MRKHDLKAYFESLAEQGFQNNLFLVLARRHGVSALIGDANLPSRVEKALTTPEILQYATQL